jgi:hypothetical protein
MVPYFSVKKEIENQVVKGEFILSNNPTISTYLAYHKDKWLSPSMIAMMTSIKLHSKKWN